MSIIEKTFTLLFSAITFLIIIYFFKYFSSINKFHTRYSAHSIHSELTPRIGGFIIYLLFLVISFLFDDIFLKDMIIIFFPLFLISFYEDFFFETKPFIRLFFMLISSILFILFFDPISSIDIPLFIFDSRFFLIFFTVISIILLTNAFNMIDGLNGLSALTFLSIFFSIYFLDSEYSSGFYLNKYYLFIPIAVFVLFNFPIAKIFLGDLGSYFLGFYLAALTIKLFNDPNLLSWNAVLLLIYPVTEITYTFFRRILSLKSPMSPDNKHLHSLVYNWLEKCIKKNSIANCLSTLFLLPLIAYGPILSSVFSQNLFIILLLIFIYLICYHFLYRFLIFLTFK